MSDKHDPTGIFCVIPSRVAVGEGFSVKVRVLGSVHEIPSRGGFNTQKPGLGSPFNLNVQRKIQYVDNSLPRWHGTLQVEADGPLDGPAHIAFDGDNQGAFPGDRRPIRVVPGFRWTEPGIHFLKLRDPATGVEGWSNPVRVVETSPAGRLVWGDPHWQTFFSDGIRCPEELYAFARNEGFLEFGAISDHMEGVTDRQWDYFQAVTNDFNQPGRFVTLQGQEWTHHNTDRGAPGHRNIYYRGAGGPVLRSTDPGCDTLAGLWQTLDDIDQEILAIPHHPANVVMGVDWNQGLNPAFERAVEIYSVWGSSEKPESDGNTRPIRALSGEIPGRHVRSALERGFRLGFVGGGDVHDGRPGDALHAQSYPPMDHVPYEQGLTALWVPALTRECVFDAMATRQSYATTRSRILLEISMQGTRQEPRLSVVAASEEDIAEVMAVRNGLETPIEGDGRNGRRFSASAEFASLDPGDYIYIRVQTAAGNMAWSSPLWGDEWRQ